MQRYAITDRRSYGSSEPEHCSGLLRQVEAWARGGVEWIQVREKDLDTALLFSLVSAVVKVVAEISAGTRVLVNGPASMARAAGATGVHLPGGELAALGDRVREARDMLGASADVSVACHSVDEARAARLAGASVLLFAPVFEKQLGAAGRALPGAGLTMLHEVCSAASPVPVLALGGVTRENASHCIAAGAAGVAGIRLFAGDAWSSGTE